MGNMIMYLHFTPGDNLWFYGWAPRTAGAMGGTCVALFLLALVERWLSALKACAEMHWHQRYVHTGCLSRNRAGADWVLQRVD